jgi:hypothetical protein
MLLHEGEIYASFPSYLSEDWSGYHYIAEVTYDTDGVCPVNAVVPRYYGTYQLEPAPDDGTKEFTDDTRPVFSLFEECGKPIQTPRLTRAERYVGLL